jgi:4-aminobutyrate aminotransferase-like enzyme
MIPAQDLIDRRTRVLGPAYRLFYDHPLHLVRGRGATVWDADGREYIDAYNNVPSVGHCHPRVVAALSAQAGELNTHTRYLHDAVIDYAEALAATFPDPLSQVMLTCTGSEANDLALRIAWSVSGSRGVIVTDNAYHGVTASLAEISPSLGPAHRGAAHVRRVPVADTFRLGTAAEAAFLDGIRSAIASLQSAGHGVAALICDSVFASDGLFVDPPGLLARAAALVRASGGLFIADEVQAGLARSGKHMWAFQRHDVVPDLVTLGKPLGGGHPLAGLVAQPRHLDAFGRATRYFNTFGGNPVSAIVGSTVLDVIRQEQLMANADRVGEMLTAGLRDIASRHPLIGDVRGSGLFVAIDLVEEPRTKGPATSQAARLMNLLRENGVLVGLCGPALNCLKIRPPLCLTSSQATRVLEGVDSCLVRLRAPA